ncbi:MAG: class I SAM-dependent methyltransferase [Candidatus Alcyoniella australis]|nr:class I SAM-dependent methyltransferase [Candidatus Alcyoniella australis]
MAKRSQWEEFFDNHAPQYMQNEFTANTTAEVDFLIEQLGLTVGQSVLDVGCGTGRHAVELASRGFEVTGVDFSQGMLDQARLAAQRAGVELELIRSDVAQFHSQRQYDAAICLCEGGLALLGAEDDPIERDLQVLRNILESLKPGAGFLMTTLNGLRQARLYSAEDVAAGRYDPLTMCEHSTMEIDAPQGKQTINVRERGYVATELRLMLTTAGFDVQHVWGGTAGNWGRRPLEIDEFEIMAVARRP